MFFVFFSFVGLGYRSTQHFHSFFWPLSEGEIAKSVRKTRVSYTAQLILWCNQLKLASFTRVFAFKEWYYEYRCICLEMAKFVLLRYVVFVAAENDVGYVIDSYRYHGYIWSVSVRNGYLARVLFLRYSCCS